MWGPSDAELRASAMSEVTGSWVDNSSSEGEVSDVNVDDSDESGNADWADADEEDQSDGELMESAEAVAFADEYHVDGTGDIAYYDFTTPQGLQHRTSVSPTKRSRNV
jgi:hypothetical protein